MILHKKAEVRQKLLHDRVKRLIVSGNYALSFLKISGRANMRREAVPALFQQVFKKVRRDDFRGRYPASLHGDSRQ